MDWVTRLPLWNQRNKRSLSHSDSGTNSVATRAPVHDHPPVRHVRGLIGAPVGRRTRRQIEDSTLKELGDRAAPIAVMLADQIRGSLRDEDLARASSDAGNRGQSSVQSRPVAVMPAWAIVGIQTRIPVVTVVVAATSHLRMRRFIIHLPVLSMCLLGAITLAGGRSSWKADRATDSFSRGRLR
jgi:hypothetical protein